MSWYEVVESNEPISQGDIFFKCPIFTIAPEYHFGDLEKLKKTPLAVADATVIILTQACDLDISNGRTPKVNDVIVAVVYDVRGQSWNTVSNVYNDKVNSMYLLNESSESISMTWQIVSFKDLYTLPYNFLSAFREYHGPRLRLKSPYLENLSHKFGNYFSRVGLPNETSIDKPRLESLVKTHEPKPGNKKQK